jgi:hypothetical protein
VRVFFKPTAGLIKAEHADGKLHANAIELFCLDTIHGFWTTGMVHIERHKTTRCSSTAQWYFRRMFRNKKTRFLNGQDEERAWRLASRQGFPSLRLFVLDSDLTRL